MKHDFYPATEQVDDVKIGNMGILKLAEAYRDGTLDPVLVVNYLLKKVEEEQPRINAFINISREKALNAAKMSAERLARKQSLSILDGIPYAVKDVIDVEGFPTTSGSDLEKDRIIKKNAFTVQKLEEAGAIVLGKTNTSQYALGATGTISSAGACKNPHNPEYITGGSSSGSAAAVAANLCPFALGTDTGGSVRAPAGLCGTIGIRPTHGRVSANGMLLNCQMLDTIGVISREVEDAAIVLDCISGHDPEYACSLRCEGSNLYGRIEEGVQGMVIGVPIDYFKGAVEPYVWKAIEDAVEIFRGAGVEVKKVQMPDIEEYRSVMSILLMSEAYTVHEENLKNHREYYDPELLERFAAVENVKMTEYIRLSKKRFFFKKKFDEIFNGVDAILLPTQAMTAVRLTFEASQNINGNTQNYYELSSRFLWFTAFAGTTAMNVPCGFHNGLPLGLQLLAPEMGEGIILRLAYFYTKNKGGVI